MKTEGGVGCSQAGWWLRMRRAWPVCQKEPRLMVLVGSAFPSSIAPILNDAIQVLENTVHREMSGSMCIDK